MTKNADSLAANWARYRDNPVRHLGDIAAYTEKQTMNALTEAGYPTLAMQYSAPLTLLYQRPMRLTELAELLNMSKQLCLQSLQPIKKAGYIYQQADSDDRRAKLIYLSDQGKALVNDATKTLFAINQEFSSIIGKSAHKVLGTQLVTIGTSLELASLKNAPKQAIEQNATLILGMLSRELHAQLAVKLARSGHLQLQLSYAQVLLYVGLSGTSISNMAEYNGVTVQAISRVVKELEARGYVTRKISPVDKRSRNVCFTAQGLMLINDSVAVMIEQEQQIIETIGNRGFAKLTKHLTQLHQALGLNTYTVAPYEEDLAKGILSKKQAPKAAPTISKQALLKHFSATLAGDAGDINVEAWIGSRLSAKEARELKRLVQKLHVA